MTYESNFIDSCVIVIIGIFVDNLSTYIRS